VFLYARIHGVEKVIVERSQGRAIITMDAISRGNSLDAEIARRLTGAIADAEADETVGALIVTGRPPFFCAGAHRDLLTRAGDPEDLAARAEIDAIYDLFLALGTSRLPTIAAVNGAAVGAGLNLAMAADICVVARDARLRSGFLRIDLHPGGGHHFLLRRRCGLAGANALAMFDVEIDGERAASLGLAWEAVDADRVLERACEIAETAAGRPALSRSITRTVRRAGAGSNWPAQVEAESGPQLRSLLLRHRTQGATGDG
jgi:enoyl-CoA hydratase